MQAVGQAVGQVGAVWAPRLPEVRLEVEGPPEALQGRLRQVEVEERLGGIGRRRLRVRPHGLPPVPQLAEHGAQVVVHHALLRRQLQLTCNP
eukprot:6479308-Pyramimonas_sp.AAC.1